MLSKNHWNLLLIFSKALRGKNLTSKGDKGFYIQPLIEGNEVVDIKGFDAIFSQAHQSDFRLALKDFLDLVASGYLEKARQGNYYLLEDKILADVDAHLSQNNSENAAFRLPDSSPQFQCDIFMVMPFREHLNPVYTDHIKALAESMGYSIKRGDDPFSQHDIITEIWSLINNAKLIIADCTDKNPNVFYEMGLAHAIGKPVILLTQNVEDIPFDIRQRRFIKYEYTPRGVKQLEEDLHKAIEGILS